MKGETPRAEKRGGVRRRGGCSGGRGLELGSGGVGRWAGAIARRFGFNSHVPYVVSNLSTTSHSTCHLSIATLCFVFLSFPQIIIFKYV